MPTFFLIYDLSLCPDINLKSGRNTTNVTCLQEQICILPAAPSGTGFHLAASTLL